MLLTNWICNIFIIDFFLNGELNSVTRGFLMGDSFFKGQDQDPMLHSSRGVEVKKRYDSLAELDNAAR